MNELDKKILKIINDQEKPILKNKLIWLLKTKDAALQTKTIIKSINYLIRNYKIQDLSSGKLFSQYIDGNIIPGSEAIGIIKLNNKLNGFVKLEDQTEVYINRKNLNGALDNDKVQIIKTDKLYRDELVSGNVIAILERNTTDFVVEIIREKDRFFGRFTNFKNYFKPIFTTKMQLQHQDKVLFHIERFDKWNAYGKVKKIIAKACDIDNDIKTIVYDYGIEPQFSQAVLNYAQKLSLINYKNDINRKDLAHLSFITIDPETAKDLDDAFFVEKLANNDYRLLVSIADVSHYVKPNSLLDQIAFERANSIYLINEVIPMLPQILSDHLCSLNPNEPKLCLTCEMIIDNKGHFKNIKVYKSSIISYQRFAYQEVNDYFEAKNPLLHINIKIRKMLDIAHELYIILRNNFTKRGYVYIGYKEPKFILDNKNNITDIVLYEQKDAQLMIENFMVAANEAVTIKFSKLNLPFIYRVHSKPEPAKFANFVLEMRKLNYIFNLNLDNVKHDSFGRWLQTNNIDTATNNIISKLLLATMAKAAYQTNNIGHFGLATYNYTHFTSPIRRYADVIVHQLYKLFILEKELYTDQDRAMLSSKLDSICLQINNKEKQAINLERDVNKIKIAKYMDCKINQFYNGIVSYVTEFGCFVALENSIEGFCNLELIDIDDFFIYNHELKILQGKNNSQNKLSFGTKVEIKVHSVNLINYEINFSIKKIIIN